MSGLCLTMKISLCESDTEWSCERLCCCDVCERLSLRRVTMARHKALQCMFKFIDRDLSECHLHDCDLRHFLNVIYFLGGLSTKLMSYKFIHI